MRNAVVVHGNGDLSYVPVGLPEQPFRFGQPDLVNVRLERHSLFMLKDCRNPRGGDPGLTTDLFDSQFRFLKMKSDILFEACIFLVCLVF
jgi:hypothetical protein